MKFNESETYFFSNAVLWKIECLKSNSEVNYLQLTIYTQHKLSASRLYSLPHHSRT